MRKLYDRPRSMTSIMREAMGTNVKRGFNSLFIVLAFAWAASCLVIFLKQQIKEVGMDYGHDTHICYASEYTTQAEKAECLKRAEQTFKTDVAQWTLGNFYHGAWRSINPYEIAFNFGIQVE